MGVSTGIGENVSLNANIDVSAGNKSTVEFLVANTGTAPVRNLSFKSNKPEAWNVAFEPDTVPSLDPGDVQKVTTVIEPPGQTEVGDYLLTLLGTSPETS